MPSAILPIKPGRNLWRPKFTENAQQCASCPFRVGNTAEFSDVVARLRKAEGIPGKPTKGDVGFARMSLYVDAERTGDFMCHCSVYDAEMKQKPMTEWRQCPGASHVYRHGSLPPKQP